MPGNSQRKGSIRKTTKKPTAGSGGRVKRGLEGRGPTPKAEDRPYHKTHKQKVKSERQKSGRQGSSRPRRRTTSSDAEPQPGPLVGTFVGDCVHGARVTNPPLAFQSHAPS